MRSLVHRASTSSLPAAQPTRLVSHKKRNVERACDACRRRKTRCDGPKMPDNICSNCIQNSRSCVYLEASKPRGPPKAYVTSMEDRMEKLDALLKRLRPEVDFSDELGPPFVRDSWKNDDPDSAPPPTRLPDKKSTPSHPPPIPYSSLPAFNTMSRLRKTRSAAAINNVSHAVDLSDLSEDYPSSDSDNDPLSLTTDFTTVAKRLTLHGLDSVTKGDHSFETQTRYYGRSSSYHLVSTTRELKKMHINDMIGDTEDKTDAETARTRLIERGSLRREEFWKAPPWELAWERVHITSPKSFPNLLKQFPELDLAQDLINLFFRHVNCTFPLLHRPTYERQFADKMHETDIWFACLSMAMFAVASRYSKDERVLMDVLPGEEPDEHRWQKAGCRFFFACMDVVLIKRSWLTPACLNEVQTLCLITSFMRETPWHPSAWIAIGTGIRKVQDVGAHRRRVYGSKPSVEEELWKRVFWYLIGQDRIGSVMLGRPCMTHQEDFDAELPLEVDDEYWENDDPELAFQQPEGKPSRVTAYNLWLRLTDIIDFVLRTFYAIHKPKGLPGFADQQKPEEVLKEMNDALSKWTSLVPDHLKWTPNMADPVFADQSMTLYITYNLVQITIHRTFLPPTLGRLRLLGVNDVQLPGTAPSQAMTSLAIAVNAAKSITRFLEALRRRGMFNESILLPATELCVAILCLNVWVLKARQKARKLKGLDPSLVETTKIDGLLEDVESLMEGLDWAVPKWAQAGEIAHYLRTAIPQATDEPEGIDDIPLEIMPPVDADFSVDVSSDSDPYYQQAMEHSWYQIPAYTHQLPSIQESEHPVQSSEYQSHIPDTSWDMSIGQGHQPDVLANPYISQAASLSSSYGLDHGHPHSQPFDHTAQWATTAYPRQDLPPIVPPLTVRGHKSTAQSSIAAPLPQATRPPQFAPQFASVPIRKKSMYVSERGQYNPQELSAMEDVYAHPSDVPAWDYGNFGPVYGHGQGQVGSMGGRVENEAVMGVGYNGGGGGGGGDTSGHAGGSGMGWYGAGQGHHSRHGPENTKVFGWDDVEAYMKYGSIAEGKRLAEAQAQAGNRR